MHLIRLILQTGIGMNNTLLCLAGILVIGTIVSIAWAPETKGKTLSQACTVGDDGTEEEILKVNESLT